MCFIRFTFALIDVHPSLKTVRVSSKHYNDSFCYEKKKKKHRIRRKEQIEHSQAIIDGIYNIRKLCS